MTKNLMLMAIATIGLLGSCGQIANADQAPAIETLDYKGNQFDLETFKGSYVVLDFWASWCGPCHRELPELIAAHPALKAGGVELISIAIERDAELGRQFSDKMNLPWKWQIVRESRFLRLDEIASNYGVSEIPTSVIIDPDGAIVSYHTSVADLLEQLKAIGAY